MTQRSNKPVPIGAKTIYGRVVAIGFVGERYYWLKKGGTISMMPACAVEVQSLKREGEKE